MFGKCYKIFYAAVCTRSKFKFKRQIKSAVLISGNNISTIATFFSFGSKHG